MEINVLIDEEFAGRLEAGWLQGVVQTVLDAEHAAPDVEVGLVITSQERVQDLNRDYRGVDEPTDVLAFGMLSAARESGSGLPSFVAAPDGVRHLGEVIISYPQAVTQAEERHHSIRREIAILTIHGVLHLLGYDHEALEEEHRMSAREAEILTQIEELP